MAPILQAAATGKVVKLPKLAEDMEKVRVQLVNSSSTCKPWDRQFQGETDFGVWFNRKAVF